MENTISTFRCSVCGSDLSLDAKFCSRCGNQIPAVIVSPTEASVSVILSPVPNYSTSNERNQAAFCHLATLLGWIIPFGDLILTFIIWNSNKESSEFVNVHGKEAVNYQISFYIWTIIFGLLACIWIGIPFLIILAIVDITIPIIAAVKASKGETYKYPLIFRFIK